MKFMWTPLEVLTLVFGVIPLAGFKETADESSLVLKLTMMRDCGMTGPGGHGTHFKPFAMGVLQQSL